jgi:hypothetical protein
MYCIYPNKLITTVQVGRLQEKWKVILCRAMKQKIVTYILGNFLLILLFTPPFVFSHTADESYTDLFLSENSQKLQINLSITWVELQYIIGDVLDPDLPASEQHIPYELVKQYIGKYFSIQNNNVVCEPLFQPLPKKTDSELVFGRGVVIPITYTCDSVLETIHLTNMMFVEEFPLQQHFVTVFDDQGNEVFHEILTKDKLQVTFSLDHLPEQTDNDHEERSDSDQHYLSYIAFITDTQHVRSFIELYAMLQSFQKKW